MRVAIGFSGGQTLAAKIAPETLDELRKALEGDRLWHRLVTEDGEVDIDLSKVLFVQTDAGEHRVGFGLSS